MAVTATKDRDVGEETATDDLSVGPVESHADLLAAAELYRGVFGYRTPGLDLNTNLLTALTRNGGSSVGVWTGAGELVGYAYGFPATDGTRHYHYSQTTVVAEDHQDRGVGRRLKLAQRDVARDWGQTRMRWAFDPRLTRNGHFNLVTLGATGIGFVPDYYRRPATDRVVVEWDLDDEPDPYAAQRDRRPGTDLRDAQPGDAVDGTHDVRWVPVDTPVEEPQRARLRSTLRGQFADGLVLVGCARVATGRSAYLFVPRATERR